MIASPGANAIGAEEKIVSRCKKPRAPLRTIYATLNQHCQVTNPLDAKPWPSAACAAAMSGRSRSR